MRTTLTFLLLLSFWSFVRGQTFNFQLTGNPMNTTGWTTSPQSSVSGDEFVLTNPVANQSGTIYYSTPQNLSNCSQFSVSFEFKISNSSNPTADGIAFWYISNPPTGFVTGGGLGLPSNPNGLLLLLDTYNNDGPPNNNPLVSLRRLDGSTNYVEGSPTGRIAPDLEYQSFITDGSWHTCLLTYSFGVVEVSFDGNPPVMVGNTTLSITGYFGFSAGTGSYWSRQAIRNVSIQGAHEPSPPLVENLTYCQGEPAAPLTAQGSNLRWYTTPTGGTPLPGAPTPNTEVPGTYTWYVSEEVPSCNLESTRSTLVVTVKPLPEDHRNVTICKGESYLFYGRALTAAGRYDTIRPGAAGACDTVVILDLAVEDVPTPVVHPSEEVLVCPGGMVELRVQDPGGYTYQWLRSGAIIAGAVDPSLQVTVPGSYKVIRRQGNCRDTSEAVAFGFYPQPSASILTPEKEGFCAGDTLLLQAEIAEAGHYQWYPALPFLIASGTDEGSSIRGVFQKPGTEVRLIVRNEFGCTDTQSIFVRTRVCCDLFVPNAFSPNQDGLNDFFLPTLQVGQKLEFLYVFNRLGEKVFVTFHHDGWDGRIGEAEAEQGYYMYYLEYTCADGSRHRRKGDLLLIR